MRDVNDTGFKLVFGRANWRDQFGVDAEAAIDAEADVVYDVDDRCVTLRPRVDRFPRSTVEPALTPSDRTSVARDQYGSWYWIDPAERTRILVRNAGDGSVEPFWSSEFGVEREALESRESKERGVFHPVKTEAPDRQPLGGLTVTADHRLVVGARRPNQLLVFDLHAGGPPERIPWFEERTFAPLDMTRRPDGGLYVLEAPESEQPRIWVLDRRFRPERRPRTAPSASVFRPVGSDEELGEEGEETSSSAPPVGPISLPAGLRPRVILALPDDTLLVLSVPSDADGSESTVYRYRLVGTGGVPVDIGRVNLTTLLEPAEEEAAGIDWSTWRAHDIAFQPGSPGFTEAFRGTLYVVGRDGNQAYTIALAGDADAVEATLRTEYIPLRRFSGKGLVEIGGDVYYDIGSRWLPLTAQRRPRFVDYGQIRSAPFDSSIPVCTWHRIFIDACIPPETNVRIESRASDNINRLSDQPWRPEPDLYRRSTGAEIPYYDPFPLRESGGGRGTWEVLLQNAEGRYLQVRLTLRGSGRAAPRLYAFRVYGPRFSYLKEYMPDLYQEDESSASFVERFLAISEGTLTHIEGRIAAVQALFDVRTVPDKYVDWLGTWFGTSFDRALDVRRKRLFLQHAVELYNQRGTLAGLARILTLVLDPCASESLFTPAGVAAAVGRPGDADDRTAHSEGIRLVEQFAARDVPRAVVGDATAPVQPTEVRVDQPWVPADGADVLHRRFLAFLDRERYDGPDARMMVWKSTSFPPLLPSTQEDNAGQKRADWRMFVRRVIDGPYAVVDKESVRDQSGDQADAATRRFRAFLQRRYRTMDRLRAVWKTTAENFEDVRLPRELPAGAALRDWMHFTGAVLPVNRAAHRFSVLVPVDRDADIAEQRARLDLARRVVERERPVHTTFEVLPYAAAFRIGTARIGLDTVLGEGARYLPLLLGEGALARHTLGRAHPNDVRNRRIVGRDRAGTAHPL